MSTSRRTTATVRGMAGRTPYQVLKKGIRKPPEPAGVNQRGGEDRSLERGPRRGPDVGRILYLHTRDLLLDRVERLGCQLRCPLKLVVAKRGGTAYRSSSVSSRFAERNPLMKRKPINLPLSPSLHVPISLSANLRQTPPHPRWPLIRRLDFRSTSGTAMTRTRPTWQLFVEH